MTSPLLSQNIRLDVEEMSALKSSAEHRPGVHRPMAEMERGLLAALKKQQHAEKYDTPTGHDFDVEADETDNGSLSETVSTPSSTTTQKETKTSLSKRLDIDLLNSLIESAQRFQVKFLLLGLKDKAQKELRYLEEKENNA